MIDHQEPNLIIVIRIFAEVSTLSAAQEMSDALIAKVRTHGRVLETEVKRYWKIQEYYEVFVKLKPLKQTPCSAENIMSDLGTGWNFRKSDNTFSSIWVPSSDGKLFSPVIRWANIELFDADLIT